MKAETAETGFQTRVDFTLIPQDLFSSVVEKMAENSQSCFFLMLTYWDAL